MKKYEITMLSTLVFEIDDESQDFKDLFKSYQEYIQDCNIEEFIESIASLICRYGVDENIECVGTVMLDGEPQSGFVDGKYTKLPRHPINLIAEYDLNKKVEFEPEYSAQEITE